MAFRLTNVMAFRAFYCSVVTDSTSVPCDFPVMPGFTSIHEYSFAFSFPALLDSTVANLVILTAVRPSLRTGLHLVDKTVQSRDRSPPTS